ncbi:hypothetical protein ScPMuIL_011027 [Solemya velum]
MTETSESKQRWVPLESNPDVLNKYVHNLGIAKKWSFVDVYGMDDELLAMVPRPVVAVMLLYPLTDKAKASDFGEVKQEADIYFVKQTIGNACGTIALVHAVANNTDKIEFEAGKHFKKFLESTEGKSPAEKAALLENDQEMGSAHEDSAQEGQTQAPSKDEKTNNHFIAFVCKDGELYELDGRKEGPVSHSKSRPDTMLEDTIKVVKKFMERDPDELNFTLMALVKNE